MDLPTRMFQQSMDHMNQYSEENRISADLACQMRAFLMQARHIHRQKFFNQVLAILSPKLLGLVNQEVHGGWSRILKAYWKLDGVPDVEVDRWLMVLVTKLRPRVFIPQEQIIEENSLPRHMFIVSRGLIGVLGKVCRQLTPTKFPHSFHKIACRSTRQAMEV